MVFMTVCRLCCVGKFDRDLHSPVANAEDEAAVSGPRGHEAERHGRGRKHGERCEEDEGAEHAHALIGSDIAG